MNIVFILVVAVLALTTFFGYKKGIIKMALSMLSLVITLVAVFMFTPVISSILKNSTTVAEGIHKVVEEKIITDEFMSIGDEEKIIDSLELPEAVKNAIKNNNTAADYVKLGVNNFREYLIAYISEVIFNAIVFIISFVIIFILVRILFAAINLISHLPVIKEANALLGVALGFVEGLIIVWLFFAGVTMFGSTELAKTIFAQINDNAFLTFIYSNNLIVKYIFSLVKA